MSGNYPYQSWSARFPNGMQGLPTPGNGNPNSAGGFGDITSNLYWSQNLGPIHLLVLNSYFPFAPGTDQYKFAVADLAAVNRVTQPWLFVMHHTPLYHSYHIHWKDSECFRAVYEPLYMKYGVDFVFAGHVHAFERTHPVYDYQPNACGPVYFTLGDGGNVEAPYRNFIDDLDPLATKKNNNTPVTWCESTQGGGAHGTAGNAKYGSIFSSSYNPNSKWGPSYQRPVNPPSCSSFTYQPGGGSVTRAPGGLLPDPSGSGNFFCQSNQPIYSAFRDPSFGFSTLNLTSDTSATFSWFRTSTANGNTPVAVDVVTYTRKAAGSCAAPVAAAAAKVTAAAAPSAPPVPAALKCGKWVASSAFYAWFTTCANVPGSGVNYTTCCPSIDLAVGAKTAPASSANCLCDAETAGLIVGALGGAGNGPLGTNPYLTLVGPGGILQQCTNQGFFSDVYWPTGNASNPNDCGAGLVVPPALLPGSVRAPYLMNVTSSSVVIRWRTAVPVVTAVNCGAAMTGLAACASADMRVGSTPTLEHAALLSGLTAATQYYYSASGVSSPTAAAGTTATANTYFTTAPSSFTAAANVRFWVHGDFGSQSGGMPTTLVQDSSHQAGVLAAWLGFEVASGRNADAWLALGDTVYNTGSDPLFQYNFHNIYGAGASAPIARMPTWPILGNHDTYSWMYGNNIAPNPANNANFPFLTTLGDAAVNATGYYTSFGSSLPTNGEALNGGPGVPSGTFRYYSFNYGRVHVIALDSMTVRSNASIPWDPTVGTTYPTPATSMPALGAAFDAKYAAAGSPNQMEWLAADLAAVNAAGKTDWIVCTYHHPSYSAGSHNSDTEIEMIEMRTLYNPILEAGGVDICFHGHSHGYERMLPTAGFFGTQATWNASTMAASGYTAATASAPAQFVKPTGLSANKGTTYVVAGSGGQFSAASATNYKFVSRADTVAVESNTGSIALDIVGNVMTLTFIGGGTGTLAQGQIGDVFLTCKGSCPATPAAPAPAPAAVKDNNTIVYASFGDWGWGAGGNNSLLQNAAAAKCFSSPCTPGNQGYYTLAGYAQISQQAVANAMGATCQQYGGCDFLMNTGDNFYDLGITGGIADPQWQTGYLNVYTHPGLTGVPILGTLGNHDYSILSPTAAASQIAYTAVDPSGRWYIPAHTYQRTFASSNGAVSLQVVSVDSTPLHDRYLYAGASGGSYSSPLSGVADTVNSVATNAVLNPGVTAANGFTNGNYFNATNWQCYYNFKPSTSGGFTVYPGATAYPGTTATGYDFVTTAAGWANTASGNFSKASSGCKYASVEIAPLASPAARAATWSQVTSLFQSSAAQYQVMFSHFPLLSTQQRLTPYYDTAVATLTALGAAGPQAYYNGHDHIMAAVVNSATLSVNGTAVPGITTGAAGVSDYPAGGTIAQLPAGYAVGAAASTAAQGNTPLAAQPAAGTAGAAAAYNPDVASTTFWSNYNGCASYPPFSSRARCAFVCSQP